MVKIRVDTKRQPGNQIIIVSVEIRPLPHIPTLTPSGTNTRTLRNHEGQSALDIARQRGVAVNVQRLVEIATP